MRVTLRYVVASISYLVVGITLVALTFLDVVHLNLTAFYFMQLYGFVAMMIFGLSYLFIPAFSHAFLYSLRLAKLQFWLANVGTIGLSVALSGALTSSYARLLMSPAFVIQVLAVYVHAYNIIMTLRKWKKSPGREIAERR